MNLFVAFRTDLAEGSEILHSRLREDYNNKVPAVLSAIKEWASLTDTVGLLLHFFHLKHHMFNLNCGRHINFTRATDEP